MTTRLNISGWTNGVATVNGGTSSDDTIVGPNGGAQFNATADQAGTVNGNSYEKIENLEGGDGDDQFVIADMVAIPGTVNGGAGGNDTLNFSNVIATAVTVTATSLSANNGFTGVVTGTPSLINGGAADGFLNINAVVGTGNNDTLEGQVLNGGIPVDGTFNLSASSGTFVANLRTLNFSDFNVFTGGNANDTFNVNSSRSATLSGSGGADAVNLAAGAVLSGNVSLGNGDDTLSLGDGADIDSGSDVEFGAGNDSLEFTAYTSPRDIRLDAQGAVDGYDGQEALLSFSFNDVNTIAGGSATDSLTGVAGQNSRWEITTLAGASIYRDSADTARLTFSEIDDLTGSDAGDDAFEFLAGATGTYVVTGGVGAGADQLTATDAADLTISGQDSGTGTVGTANVTFNSTESLAGGNAADQFTFSNAGSLTGRIDGGGGEDTLTGDDDGNVVHCGRAEYAGNLARTSFLWVVAGNSAGSLMWNILTGGARSGHLSM